jgi:DNA-binding GntR family transcriptional regulator
VSYVWTIATALFVGLGIAMLFIQVRLHRAAVRQLRSRPPMSDDEYDRVELAVLSIIADRCGCSTSNLRLDDRFHEELTHLLGCDGAYEAIEDIREQLSVRMPTLAELDRFGSIRSVVEYVKANQKQSR